MPQTNTFFTWPGQLCSTFFLLTTVVPLVFAGTSFIEGANIKQIGFQTSPSVTNVSRDGGHSTFVNGKTVFLYADTSCFNSAGQMASFLSNTASMDMDSDNATVVQDFGITKIDAFQTAINNASFVPNDGWIPFTPEEVAYNKDNSGVKRVAICKLELHRTLLQSPENTNFCRAWIIPNSSQHYTRRSLCAPC
jgi:hypothetical protein